MKMRNVLCYKLSTVDNSVYTVNNIFFSMSHLSLICFFYFRAKRFEDEEETHAATVETGGPDVRTVQALGQRDSTQLGTHVSVHNMARSYPIGSSRKCRNIAISYPVRSSRKCLQHSEILPH